MLVKFEKIVKAHYWWLESLEFPEIDSEDVERRKVTNCAWIVDLSVFSMYTSSIYTYEGKFLADSPFDFPENCSFN